MTGTDAPPRLRPPPHPVAGPLPDVLAAHEAEFFVEWQVSPAAATGPQK